MSQVQIKGVIVANDDLWIYEWFEMEATSPNKVAEEIAAANGEELEIYINSPGGDVFAGSEIYSMLKEYKGSTTGKIVGIAASAASVAAMGIKNLLIAPTAQIMIHNVSSMAAGDYRTMQHESEVLKNWNTSIANAYALKSGVSTDELLRMMNKETWLTAQQALEQKFVDGILFDEERTLSFAAAAGGRGLLPRPVIDKVRNELLAARKPVPPPEAERTPKAPLSLYEKIKAHNERKYV
ncbi:peptidase [Paenibacillus stellifer]|uniref:ATP-dependent Clp protease proteolytic subunit n=1 Tax=Paenibacillus stellifer TaxID=169760 RepID=A0A089LP25_9BACL|nr:head maturation protease, ClpP-related [Paenibacillus stellifer]AIQ61850.1 peptidase [Paenibacillus stellifer]